MVQLFLNHCGVLLCIIMCQILFYLSRDVIVIVIVWPTLKSVDFGYCILQATLVVQQFMADTVRNLVLRLVLQQLCLASCFHRLSTAAVTISVSNVLMLLDCFMLYYHRRRRNLSCNRQLFSTISLLILLGLYTLPYWSNPPFLIFDIRAPQWPNVKSKKLWVRQYDWYWTLRTAAVWNSWHRRG